MAETSPEVSVARLSLRTAGYCVVCDRIVERTPDGACPNSHPAAAVIGRVVLQDDEAVPSLPRFNWAAFALPPVWGPANGQWVGLFFIPIWLFADSAVASASVNTLTRAMAVAVVIGTLAFQAFFAKRANGLAWRRVWEKYSIERFARNQRMWAFACVPTGILLAALMVDYRFFVS